MPLTGSYNAVNALAAATCATSVGIPEDVVVAGLSQAQPIPGRFEVVDAPGPVTIIVDYAHTPDGLATAIASARQLAAGKRVVLVFGCGGDRDRAKRPVMGAVSEAQADLVVVTSDNSRGEKPEDIIEEILGGIRDRSRTLVEPNRAAALELALDMAAAGDVVLVAGKGHETTIEARGRQMPFDDRTEARYAAARSLDRAEGPRLQGPAVISLMSSGGLALVVAALATPVLMGWLVRKRIGQPIREEGPATHQAKAGTPTMGGLAMLGGSGSRLPRGPRRERMRRSRVPGCLTDHRHSCDRAHRTRLTTT